MGATAPELAERYLEGLAHANERIVARGDAPPLYRSGVRWSLRDVQPLPLAHTIARRGRGACGPLAAYRVAELRHAGERGARAIVRPSASGIPGRWHAVVRRADGSIEDPSRRVGMLSASPAPRLRCSTRPDGAGRYCTTVYVPTRTIVGHGRACVAIVGGAAGTERDAMRLAIRIARVLADTPALAVLATARSRLALAACDALMAGRSLEEVQAATMAAGALAAGRPDLAASAAAATKAARAPIAPGPAPRKKKKRAWWQKAIGAVSKGLKGLPGAIKQAGEVAAGIAPLAKAAAS